jgi:Ca-activated chloride channel homolog
MIRFQAPYWLGLLALVPVLFWWSRRMSRRAAGAVRFSNLNVVKRVGNARPRRAKILMLTLRMLAVCLFILAMARPQSGSTEEEVLTEGVDIILAMDLSSSMLAEDFKPKNRLEAAKVVAADFVKGRTNDRVGLVVFAGASYTQCPLTLDYGIILKFLEDLEIGTIEDGTAIGMAIATCAGRLRESKAKSRVVILLTDGRNNRGELDPLTAARVAEALNIKIYTIGAGKRGEALYPYDDPIFGKRYVRRPVEIDEALLQQVADITGGKYFRATDEAALQRIYDEIGEMEQTEIIVNEYTRYSELMTWFLVPGFCLLLLEVGLGNTRYRKLP